jgi:hypothetical protein
MAVRVLPILYCLSDYPSADTGVADLYDNAARFVLEGLDFGDPDGLKDLKHLYMIYESLREVPISVEVWKRFPITETGTVYELTTYTTAAAQATEPGVFYGQDAPTWGTARYAHMRRFHARAEFSRLVSPAFTAGFMVAADLTPFRVIQLAWHFRRLSGPGRGSWVG